MRQPWFLRIELAARNKCLLVTTKTNLPMARAWIDDNLEPMVRKSIPPYLDPSSALLPRRLDKPIYMAAGIMYADILKKQFSLATDDTTTATANMRPPCKHPATIIDYNSDQTAKDIPSKQPKSKATTNNSNNSNSYPATTTTNNYADELLSIKKELSDLKTLLTNVVAQFKTAIESHLAPRPVTTNEMDTEEPPTAPCNPTPTPPDLSVFITDLKHELTAFITETKTMLQRE